MRDGLRGNTAATAAAFDRREYVNRLGLSAVSHTPRQLEALLAPLGWRQTGWFGVRIFTDHRDEDVPAAVNDLVAIEIEAGRRDPYRQVAALLHVTFRAPPHGLAEQGRG
jgi:S-adenosylmethionine-dependent methyltransferase